MPSPLAVEQDLDLDVAGALDEPLEDQSIVAERGDGFATSAGERVRQPLWFAHRAHPLAATTGRGFHEQWVADAIGCDPQGVVGLIGVVVPVEDRDPERSREASRRGLVAHQADRRGRRADPAEPGGDHQLGKVGVLGKEPEARVDGVGTGGPRRIDDGSGVEQVERALARWSPERPSGCPCARMCARCARRSRRGWR